MDNFRISIASYSFHAAFEQKTCDIYDYLDLLRYRYHVSFADIWFAMLGDLDDGNIKKIRRYMDDRELELANLCVDGPVLWRPTAEEREANKKSMLHYIHVADLLGAKTVRIDFGGDDGPMPEEALDYIVKTYKEYCGICWDLGMKIGPEDHWGWDRKLENLKKVKEGVDHPAYGQLYHFRPDEKELEDFCISYAMHTHIPSNTIPYAKEVIRKLMKSGYKGTLSVEHHSGMLEKERVDWQLGSLRAIVAELRDEGLDTDKPAFFTEF